MVRYRPVWAEINLTALQNNYRTITEHSKSPLMPIVKADAYGHGAVRVVEALRACGARRFAVALLEEALELKEAFPDIEIMVLGIVPPENAATAVEKGIILAVASLNQAKALSRLAQQIDKTAIVHIKVDTGMGRIGFRPEEIDAAAIAATLPNIFAEGLFAHFAAADSDDLTFANTQLNRFIAFDAALKAQGINIAIRHTSNSAAIIQLPEGHFEMTRPGVILYGLAPSPETAGLIQLEPVLSWKAAITHVKQIEAGDTVSYGQTFTAKKTMTVATIPVGYADGLRRNLSNNGEALLNGVRVPIIGRVCMDQTMLDITAVPTAKTGDIVTLIGRDGNDEISAAERAAKIGTINYEIVCGISKRVPREEGKANNK